VATDLDGGAMTHTSGSLSASEAEAAEPSTLDAPTTFGALKSRRLWMGAVVLALLAALGGLAGWRLGWFGGAQRPKEILRQRLETPPSTPAPALATPRPVPAPPAPALTPLPEPPAAAMSLGPVATPPAPVERRAPPASAAPSRPPATAPAAPATPPAAPAAPRFAIEFGPFMTAPEAERVAAQPGEAVVFALRHGNFATSGEAEAKGQELMRLGLGNQVVRVK